MARFVWDFVYMIPMSITYRVKLFDSTLFPRRHALAPDVDGLACVT